MTETFDPAQHKRHQTRWFGDFKNAIPGTTRTINRTATR